MAVTAAGAAPPPSQAVILAGGRGTRLGALTDSAPKPMLELHGRPFLDYLLQQLAEQGFSRALILIGYLGHVIRDHFGGQAHGLQLTYVDSPVETDTGLRLAQAQAAIDDVAPVVLRQLLADDAGTDVAALLRRWCRCPDDRLRQRRRLHPQQPAGRRRRPHRRL